MLEKIGKRNIIIAIGVIVILLAFVVGFIGVNKEKKENKFTQMNTASNGSAQSVTVTSEKETVSSKVETDTNSNTETDTDSDSDSDTGIRPVECNHDFYAVKYGIAECYDHIFKKAHMEGDIYYQGECTDHDSVEVNELAQQVKLYRYDDGSYSAILPEIGWNITIYDERIQKIIDSQIEGTGDAYPADGIAIAMSYYDNAITIEIVDKEE